MAGDEVMRFNLIDSHSKIYVWTFWQGPKGRNFTMSPAASSKSGKGKADPQEIAGGSKSTRCSLRVILKEEEAAAAPSSKTVVKKKPQPAIISKTEKKEAPLKKTKTSAGNRLS